MAVRFSNPSSGLGVNRFKVWPNKNTDAYSTVDLTANFDKTDGMFGVPAAGTQWPPTEGIDGGVYREVKLLQNDRTPIGTVIAWWRPSGAIAIPAGWVECIGQTLIAANHAFAGGGSITVPDLRNKFVLGADSAFTPGQAAVGAGDGNIDNHNGAPGLGYIGGSNQTTLVIANLPAHDHGGGSHDHGGGNHGHGVTDNGHAHVVTDPGHSHTFNRQIIDLPRSGGSYLINVRDAITHTESTNLAYTGITGTQASKANVSVNASGTIISAVAPIASQGSGTPFGRRPGYVGLIYLMKVLYSTTP